MEIVSARSSPLQVPQNDELYSESTLNGGYVSLECNSEPTCGRPKYLYTLLPLPADDDQNESAEVTVDSTIQSFNETVVADDLHERPHTEKQSGELPPFNEELQEGYKILQHIMLGLMPQKRAEAVVGLKTNLTERYMQGVCVDDPLYEKYSEIVEQPMYIGLMEQKFKEGKYPRAAQFVADFELMIWNWYCFCSLTEFRLTAPKPDDVYMKLVSQLNLLSHTMRQKIYSDLDTMTSPWKEWLTNPNSLHGSNQRSRSSTKRNVLTEMQQSVARRKDLYQKEQKRLRKEKERMKELAEQQKKLEWEAQFLTAEPMKTIIKHSWELPQIGLFLFLCDKTLCLPIPEVPMYELERCFAMPRQSNLLQIIMSCLLRVEELEKKRQREKAVSTVGGRRSRKQEDASGDGSATGNRRSRKQDERTEEEKEEEELEEVVKQRLEEQRLQEEMKKPPMPYWLWTAKLAKMLDIWYKRLAAYHGDVLRTSYELGLDEKCFGILGMTNPLRDRPFHKLSAYKAIWIVKSLIDYLVENIATLRSDMIIVEPDEKERDEFERKGKTVKIPGDQRSQELGKDRYGNTYIHMKQFCGPDLRVYIWKEPKSQRFGGKRKFDIEEADEPECSLSEVESEAESTVSTVASEPRLCKPAAGKSCQSSPVTPHSSKRSQHSSACNSPLLDSSISDTEQLASGRRTRNSAEPFFTTMIDTEVLFRKSRGRGGSKKLTTPQGCHENSSTTKERASCDSSFHDRDMRRSQKQIKENEHNLELECHRARGLWSPKYKSEKARGRGRASKKSASSHLFDDPGVNCKEELPAADAASSVLPQTETDSSKYICDTDSCAAAVSANVSSDNSNPCYVKQELIDSDSESPFLTPCDPKINRDKPVPVSSGDTSAVCRRLLTESTSLFSAKDSPVHVSSIKKETLGNDSGYTSCHTDTVSPDNDFKCRFVTSENSSNDYKKFFTDKDSSTRTKLESFSEEKELELKDLNKAEHPFLGEVVDGESRLEEAENSCAGESTSSSNLLLHDGCHVTASVSSALLDHCAYSEEEQMPDPEEFEMVVDSFEKLEELVEKFAPDAPEPAPQSTSARPTRRGHKKSKAAQKTPKRPACEMVLYDRLKNLMEEMYIYRANFTKRAMGVLERMRKEYESYVEEIPTGENLESDGEGNSDKDLHNDRSDDEDEEESVSSLPTAPPPPARKRPAAKQPVSPPEVPEQKAEEYELDISSRGRIRTPRFIPNNVEDSRPKRRKVAKKGGEEETPTSQTLLDGQLSSGQVTQDSGKDITQGTVDQTCPSATSQAAATTPMYGMRVVRANTEPSMVLLDPQAAYGTPQRVSQPFDKAYPVMQHILSRPLDGHAPQTVIQVNPTLQTPGQSTAPTVIVTTSPTVNISTVLGAPSTAAANTLFLTLPCKNLTSPQLLDHSRTKQVTGTRTASRQMVAGVATASGTNPSRHVLLASSQILSSLQNGHIFRTTDNKEVVLVKDEKGQLICLPKNLLLNKDGCQRQEGLIKPGLVSGVGQCAVNMSPAPQNVVTPATPRNAGNIAGKGAVNRYAANTTVKELLKAKCEELVDGLGMGMPREGTTVVFSPGQQPGTGAATTIIATTASNISPPRLVIPSASSLDAALQKIVTTVHTTLPTVNYKVPSPTTLPSLSPKKNATRTTASTLGPIATVPRLKSPMMAELSVVASSGVVPLSLSGQPGAVVMPVGTQVGGRNQIIVLKNSDAATAGNLLQGLMLQGAGSSGAGGVVRFVQLGKAAASPVTEQQVGTAALQLLASPVAQPGSVAIASMPASQLPASAQPFGQACSGLLMPLNSQPDSLSLTSSSSSLQFPVSAAQQTISSTVSSVPTSSGDTRPLISTVVLNQQALPHGAASPFVIRAQVPLATLSAAHPLSGGLSIANTATPLVTSGAAQLKNMASMAMAAGLSAKTIPATVAQVIPNSHHQVAMPVNVLTGVQPAVNTVRLMTMGSHGGVQQIMAVRPRQVQQMLGGLQNQMVLAAGGRPMVATSSRLGQVAGSAQAVTLLQPAASPTKKPQALQYCISLPPVTTVLPVLSQPAVHLNTRVSASSAQVVLASPSAADALQSGLLASTGCTQSPQAGSSQNSNIIPLLSSNVADPLAVINMPSLSNSQAAGGIGPLQASVGVKRGLPSGCLQPIPPKLARLESARGVAVLTALGQIAGNEIVNQASAGLSAGEAIQASSSFPAHVVGGVPRIMGTGTTGSVGASATLQNLAAHLTTTTSQTGLAALGSPAMTPTVPLIMQALNLPLKPPQQVLQRYSHVTQANSLPVIDRKREANTVLKASFLPQRSPAFQLLPSSGTLMRTVVPPTATPAAPHSLDTMLLSNGSSGTVSAQQISVVNLCQESPAANLARGGTLLGPASSSQSQVQPQTVTRNSVPVATVCQKKQSVFLTAVAPSKDAVGSCMPSPCAATMNGQSVILDARPETARLAITNDGHDEVDAEAAHNLLTLACHQ